MDALQRNSTHCWQLLLTTTWLLVGYAYCAAQDAAQEERLSDRVWVAASNRQPSTEDWDHQPVTILGGKIRQFDSQSLILQTADGSLTELSSERIDRVEFEWANQQADEAMALVDQRLYREAIPKLDQAMRSGVPRWQQRFLIAALVRSAAATNNPRTAGILFANLAASKPPPMLYADMPLVWTVRETPQVMLEQSRKWLVSTSQTEQLLGASWLLFGTDGEQAVATLRKIQQSEDSVLQNLALAQSWRLSSPPETLVELPKWLAFIGALPQPMRIGPTEFVADRLMRVGELDLAIGQWLRIATQHPDRYHRAAIALKTARQLLERQARTAEAERLDPWIEKMSIP